MSGELHRVSPAIEAEVERSALDHFPEHDFRVDLSWWVVGPGRRTECPMHCALHSVIAIPDQFLQHRPIFGIRQERSGTTQTQYKEIIFRIRIIASCICLNMNKVDCKPGDRKLT